MASSNRTQRTLRKVQTSFFRQHLLRRPVVYLSTLVLVVVVIGLVTNGLPYGVRTSLVPNVHNSYGFGMVSNEQLPTGRRSITVKRAHRGKPPTTSDSPYLKEPHTLACDPIPPKLGESSPKAVSVTNLTCHFAHLSSKLTKLTNLCSA